MSTRRIFKVSRTKRFELRDAMYKMETAIPKGDRSRITERERDLVCVFNCAIWDGKLYKLSACLRRLALVPERGAGYNKMLELLTY